MQALLSFDQAPPINAPMRYFLTAPLFAILAGVLILFSGPDIFTSRWTPAALALTHLITAGFMLQVMVGALQQLLPVVVGANFPRPLLIATLVHATITPGTLFLAAAFLTYQPLLFAAAVALLGAGMAIFVVAAAAALRGVSSANPTVQGFKISLLGVSVTVLSGLLLAVSLGLQLDWPLHAWTDLHLGWGFMVWACVLVVAVAFVTVPMFQLTPEYPVWFSRSFAMVVLVSAALWTVTALTGLALPATLMATVLVAFAAVFTGVTLRILNQGKRAKRDASHRLWTVSMCSAMVACALWLAAQFIDSLGHWQGWPLLFGVLLLMGCFMSVMVGMLYKIVPFLVWLHLQNLGRGHVKAPNMKKVLSQVQIDRQLRAHLSALVLLLLSVFWPRWFVYPAGLALILSSGWLWINLLCANAVYRNHQAQIWIAVAGAEKDKKESAC